MTKDIREPRLIEALIPIIVLIILLTLNVRYFGDEALSGANQIALALSATVAGLIAVRLGHNWKSISASIVKSIGSAMPSILILFLIGSLAGTWMISGVVPMLIYYGLKILNCQCSNMFHSITCHGQFMVDCCNHRYSFTGDRYHTWFQ